MKINVKKHLGLILFGLMLTMVAVLMALLVRFPILPTKYTIVALAFLIALVSFLLFTQLTKRYRKRFNFLGKILIILVTIGLFLTNFYLYKTEDFLHRITEEHYETDQVSVIVLKESDYTELTDMFEVPIGMDDDEEHFVVKALTEIQSEHAVALDLNVFQNHDDLINALYDGSVEGILLNEAYRELILENFPDFSKRTRIIYSIETESLIDEGKAVEVTNQPFTVYISGIDTFGKITYKSRSDVNILVTVNPITKVILLTTIPRDAYLPMGCIRNNPKDKLTHNGIYGIDCSVKTMEMAFKVDINYFIRVNFTSVEKIVDAIGGIEVDSPHAFTSNDKYSFKEGLNKLNGKQALSFARDRKHQASGDEDRGKNQLRVITAMFKKVVSPSILTNYINILKAIEVDFQTNLPFESLAALAKMQLNDMAKWTIISNSVQGRYGSDYSYAMGRPLSMFFVNQASLKHATELIEQNLKSDLISQPSVIKFPLEALPKPTYVAESEEKAPPVEEPVAKEPEKEDEPDEEETGEVEPGEVDPGDEEPGSGETGGDEPIEEGPGEGDAGDEEPEA